MDALALSLIGLGVLILLIVWISWVFWPSPNLSVAESVDVPTFRVVALGLEGAGKTVLLASQFHKLRDTGAHRRYFLDCDFKQTLDLAAIYERVSDRSALWPPGTRRGAEREFLFDCNAYDTAQNRRTVFRISYYDYAGELLEPQDENSTAEQLEKRVREAHALLVIVDGGRVRQLLSGDPDGRIYFERRMWPLLGLARRATCPVQLVLTKWDLVSSYGAPVDDDTLLREVSERLMAYGSISDLVHAHSQRQEYVRMIPVSAVGQEFADLLPNGEVAKRAKGTLDPIHVDVPLCAVIPDILKDVQRSLEPSVRQELDAHLRRPGLGDMTAITTSVRNSHVGKVLHDIVKARVGESLADFVVQMLVRLEMLVRHNAREHEPSPGDDDAETQRMRAAVITDMERVVLGFEHHLESSILRRRW